MADSVKIRITGEDSEFRKTLAGLGSVTKSAAKGFAAAGTAAHAAWKAASAGVHAAWEAVGVVGIKHNAEIEKFQTSFEVMTGSAQKAADITERLRRTGAQTPFDLKELAGTTQLLMNYGFEADRAVDEMMMLGDISQGSAEGLKSIATGYAQMSSMGKVNLQDIKQMISGGFNPLEEISGRTGESMEKLYERIEKGKMTVEEITQSMKHATSEGGRYYQSMEKQAQTFSGRLDTLKEDATAFAGQLMGSVSEGLRDTVIPMASDLLAEFSAAFERGGIDGLIDAVTGKLPMLLDTAVSVVKQGVAALSAWLPGALKQIATVIPSAVRAIAEVAPPIVAALFDVASSLVGDLITMLPELVPIILEGVGRMLLSVGAGVVTLIRGIAGGISRMLGIGINQVDVAINKLFDGVDQKRVAELSTKVKVNLNTEITPDGYTTNINTAVSDIEDALKGIEALDSDSRDEVKNAIIAGTGLDLLGSAFAEAFPEIDTQPIIDSMGTINEVIKELGLSEDAATALTDIIKEGGDAAQVKAALESFHIDSDTAGTAAGTINSEMGKINAAVDDLGLPAGMGMKLAISSLSDRFAIVTALNMYGLSDDEIQPIIRGYDTISKSLTGKAALLLDQIATTFTDGLPDDKGAAENAVKDFYKQAYRKIDEWKAQALKELEEAGLTGVEFDTKAGEIEQQWQEWTNAAKGGEIAAMDWVEENANRSTEFVQGNLAALQTILEQAQQLTAQIDILTNSAFDTARSRRTLVQKGVVTNAEHQLEAFTITSAELEERLQKAEGVAAAAFDAAAKEYATNAEAYAAEEKRIFEQLAQAKAEAYEIYDMETAKIVVGVAKSNPELVNTFTGISNAFRSLDMIPTILDSMQEAADQYRQTGELDISAVFENLRLSGVDTEMIAEMLDISPEDFQAALESRIEVLRFPKSYSALLHREHLSNVEGQLRAELQEQKDIVADALKAENIDFSGTGEVLSAAIQDGYLKPGLNGVDWTTNEALFNTMMYGVGENGVDGLVEALAAGKTGAYDGAKDMTGSAVDGGTDAMEARSPSKKFFDLGVWAGEGLVNGLLSKRMDVYRAAKALAAAAEMGASITLKVSSPSKVFERLGAFSGQGFEIGLAKSMGRAVKTARSLTRDVIGAANMPMRPNLPADVTQALAAGPGGDAPERPIYLQLDGKTVARIQAGDNRSAINRYTRRIALGVGK